MSETLSAAELLRVRMIAQGLAGPAPEAPGAPARGRADGIAATARRMFAVQGQDWRSARWALGVRTPGSSVAEVHAAFDAGAIVRSWPMRGTIHVVAAEDIGWMQALTNHRVLPGAVKRRAFLGLPDATLDRLVETSVQALRGGAALNRDELAAVWAEAGIEAPSSWRYHVIWWLCQNGLTVFGPVAATGEPRLVSAEEWIASPHEFHGDAALAEFAVRYAAPRGAVSVRDLAWWSGLTVREARRAVELAAAAGRLVSVQVEAAPGAGPGRAPDTGSSAGPGSGPEAAAGAPPTELWADPALLDTALGAPRAADLEWLLLPAFDEHLLGYQDRSAQLDPAHLERIVPGRNGMFLATVVRGGRVVGTWKRGTRRGEGLLGASLPGERWREAEPELQDRAAAWAAFHGLPELGFA